MQHSKRAPPRSAPPISTEELTVIKKRVAAPKGPPPKNLDGFRPKSMASTSQDDKYADSSFRHRGEDFDDDLHSHGSFTRYSSNSYDKYADGADIKPMARRGDSRGTADRSDRDDSKERDSRDYSFRSGRDSDRDRDRDRDMYDRERHEAIERTRSPDSLSDEKYLNDDEPPDESKDSKESSPVEDPPPLRLARNGRDQIFNYRTTVLQAKYKEMRTFVKTPMRAGVVVRCYIERSRTIGKNFLTPCYALCADMEDGTGKELITCRKIFKSKTPHYVFSLRETDLYCKREERSRVYLGKLRAVSSSEYVMYDSGTTDRTDTLCPDNINAKSNSATHDNNEEEEEEEEGGRGSGKVRVNTAMEDAVYKSQLCSIIYHSKTRPTLDLGMEVCVPTVASKTHPVLGDLRTDLTKCFQLIREEGKQNELFMNKCFILQEKKSRYDPLSSCLVDFQGRATVASVKNFQLLQSTPSRLGERKQSEKASDDEVIFQMGKLSEDCFNMDFMYPLSMLQAFAIAISRFDAKISW